MARIFCLALGYVFGLFQTGYLYGRLNGIDIRKHGSGNSGTTNALRVLGKKAGFIVFLGDFLKAIAACFAAKFLFLSTYPDLAPVLMLYAGLGVVLGHNFPFYLKFKGGKGIAATGGVIVSMADWRLFLTCFTVFVLTVAITRFVSVGSLLVVTVFFVEWILFTRVGWIVVAPPYRLESYLLVFLFTMLAYIRHKENIKKLINGTENKLWGSKK